MKRTHKQYSVTLLFRGTNGERTQTNVFASGRSEESALRKAAGAWAAGRPDLDVESNVLPIAGRSEMLHFETTVGFDVAQRGGLLLLSYVSVPEFDQDGEPTTLRYIGTLAGVATLLPQPDPEPEPERDYSVPPTLVCQETLPDESQPIRLSKGVYVF